MPKYIFVTGGVLSGLGKGITAASIGLILKSSGLTVDAVKFDPYLNIDPGTMSPYEHGEVYVLQDGSETDLDLGHYERFLDVNLTEVSSVASGKIYSKILDRERDGAYLGKNVQLIPHVTNYIKECFARETNSDVRIIEIGGSTGDYEADIFLESLRQFRQENKENIFHIHLGFVPFLACSGEYKTKPLQVSVRELSRAGLQPDMIVARYTKEKEQNLSIEHLKKLALFSNLPYENIISLPDLDNIYQVPLFLEDTTAKTVLEKFLQTKLSSQLPEFYSKIQNYQKLPTVKVAIVAKYTKLVDAYLSIFESLKIAGVEQNIRIEPILIDAEKLNDKVESEWENLHSAQAVIVPGGFGNRGMEGKILSIKWARENKIPFLGICLGMQLAIIEFARNICNINSAISSEMYESRPELINKNVIIDLMPSQFKIERKGGTMRLGNYACSIKEGSLAYTLFGAKNIIERHRHRLEVQSEYINILEGKGLVVSGKHFSENTSAQKNEQQYLVEIIELDQSKHPYFIATQSHPEFLSRPGKPHPLFLGLIDATQKVQNLPIINKNV